MRMLKVRKKSISLIVVLTFLMTLFPLALPAFASDLQTVGAVVTVEDGKVAALNSVKVEFEAGELMDNAAVIIGLPNGFKFNSAVTVNGAGANNIILQDTATPAAPVPATLTSVSDYEVKLTLTQQGAAPAPIMKKVIMLVQLGDVFVKSGFEGDINCTFDNASGGFPEGSTVVGRVSGGEVKVTVVDDENFADKGTVILRIKEDRAGALKNHSKSVKIRLPRGFEWSGFPANYTVEATKPVGININKAWMVDGVPGEVTTFKVVTSGDELYLDTTGLGAGNSTTKAAYIEIIAEIKVEDETSANTGDIIATLGGDSKVTPSEIKVGTYGDYEVEVSAADPTTVYAGQLEQKIADITLKEVIGDSLIGNRSVTLTLPDWAKWGSLKDKYDDGTKAILNWSDFPGKDGRVVKYLVENPANSTSAAKIKLDKLEVVLSPEAPEGDLEVEVAGSSGVKATVKVAEVKKPLEVTASSSPVIIIGKADQAIGDISITEAKAELIKKDKDLVVKLPKDVEWEEDYEVVEAAGDLQISRAIESANALSIKIRNDSRTASTIGVNGGKVTAFRSVPEGRVEAEIGGPAIVVVNDTVAVNKYYNGVEIAPGDNYWKINNHPAIKYDVGGLFPKDEYIAKVQVATVGTPAPGEQQIKAVFKLGSTDWYLNDVAQTMDVAPYAKAGRTYLPMRYVAKALGIPDTGILWKAGTATFISADRVVSVTVGSNVMTINGAPVPIDAAPEIVSGRTMLPIRWVATAFGVDVEWDAENQEVTVH